MKHCSNCNLDYPSDKKFCRECGAPLVDVAPRARSASEPRPGSGASEPARPTKKKGNRAWLRAASLVVSCTLVGMALPIGGLGMLLGLMVGGALATHFYLKDD